MIRKKLLSVCLALALCLSLLPVTALAAEGNGYGTIMVGGKNLTYTEENPVVYATTDKDGVVTTEGATAENYNVMWDGSTLTLRNATVNATRRDGTSTFQYVAAIYYSGLKAIAIELIGTNHIIGQKDFNDDTAAGIYLGTGSLTIDGSGVLNITFPENEEGNGVAAYGIWVGSGNVTINGGTVNAEGGTASSNGTSYGIGASTSVNINGGTVNATGGKVLGTGRSCGIYASVSVNISGGTVVATGGETYWSYGIRALNVAVNISGGTVTATGGTAYESYGVYATSVAVTDSTVKAGSAGEDGEGIATDGSSESTEYKDSVVFDNGEGTVYGNATLPGDLTIAKDETLTIPEGASLTVPEGVTLANNGDVTNNGTINNLGTVTGISDVNQKVTGVSLNKDSLTLEAGGSETLTATVHPENATNKTVNWSSSDKAVATVDTNGEVTAKAAGTATITATAADGSGKFATCTVTVPRSKYSISADTTALDFGSAYTGYTQPAAKTVTITNDGSQQVTVTLPTANDFVITAGTGFTNGSAAIEPDGTAIFTVQPKAGLSMGTYSENITVSGTNDVNATISATFTVRQYSGGGDSDPAYSVSLPSQVTGGSVTATKRYAEKGETFRFTVTPDEGYELDTLTVTDRSGKKLEVTDEGDGIYSFKMPAGRVEIEVSFREIAVELPFTDVPEGAWYEDAAAYVYEHGLMAGTSATTFAPHAATSRSMIVTILYRMEGEPVVDYAMDFTDVASDAYYTEAVRWAASEGIVSGYGNGLFGANDDVTREQLAAILYRYAVYKGYDVSIGEDTNILSYADFADLSEYAIPAMQWACGAGIVNGTSASTLSPQGEATRAQVAAMLQRFCENVSQ